MSFVSLVWKKQAGLNDINPMNFAKKTVNTVIANNLKRGLIMAKTKKAKQSYTCYLCKENIGKGDQYARKSVLIGWDTFWNHSNDCTCCYGEIPDHAWYPLRSAEPICQNCNAPILQGAESTQ